MPDNQTTKFHPDFWWGVRAANVGWSTLILVGLLVFHFFGGHCG